MTMDLKDIVVGIGRTKNNMEKAIEYLQLANELMDESFPYAPDAQDVPDDDLRFLINQYFRMGQEAQALIYKFQYLQKEVRKEGFLHLNENERYQIEDYEFSSGTDIEFMMHFSEDGESWSDWVVSRIEHSYRHGGYYIYHYPDMKLEGLRARARW